MTAQTGTVPAGRVAARQQGNQCDQARRSKVSACRSSACSNCNIEHNTFTESSHARRSDAQQQGSFQAGGAGYCSMVVRLQAAAAEAGASRLSSGAGERTGLGGWLALAAPRSM